MPAPAQIGPYSVEREIGAGGMGVVYLGYDARLDRQVAIKALPELAGEDHDRRKRFETEARALAQLNHPNIAQIHSVEEVEDRRYLVLEFVEGELLADRLDRGTLGVDDVIDVGLQLASGLEAAHQAGITHRDLKPANLKFAADGTLKILDFGLAKPDDGASSSSVATAATLSVKDEPTAEGVVLGTAAYMSPEQARGRKVDPRTDIWAFGVVLYECMTGRNPFLGETATDSLGAVLHRDPEWQTLPGAVPPGLRRLLRRCLTRDKSRRLQSIADARVELQELQDGTMGEDGAPAGTASRSRVRTAALALGASVLGAALAAAAIWTAEPTEAARVQRYALTLPDGLSMVPVGNPAFDVSRDGRRFVVRASDASGRFALYLRDAAQAEFRRLEGTEDPHIPVFSPDGEWIVYRQDNALKKVSVRGGPAISIMDGEIPFSHGAWTDDGWLYFTGNPGIGGVYRVPENGGAVQTILEPRSTEGRLPRFPGALPGGGVLLTMIEDQGAGFDLYGIPAGGSEARLLVEDAMMGRWATSGHLLFVRGASLMAALFDPRSLELRGQPVPVLEGMTWGSIFGGAQYCVTASGDLFYIAGEDYDANISVVRLSMNGAVQPLELDPGTFYQAVADAAETRIAYSGFPPLGVGEPGQAGLWVVDVVRGARVRLTAAVEVRGIQWAPDDSHLYFSMTIEDGRWGVHRVRPDGSGAPEVVVVADTGGLYPMSVSRDGRMLYCWLSRGQSPPSTDDRDSRGTGSDIVVVRLDEDNRIEEIITDPGAQIFASVSPDGDWLVYDSDETGNWELYLRRSDGTGARIPVSRSGFGGRPSWSPDGTKIFYEAPGRGSLQVVDVSFSADDPSAVPRLSPPRTLFELPPMLYWNSVFPTADGEGFLTVTTNEATQKSRIEVVLGFAGTLERGVAAGR